MQLLFNESTTRDLVSVVIDPTSLMFWGSVIELSKAVGFATVLLDAIGSVMVVSNDIGCAIVVSGAWLVNAHAVLAEGWLSGKDDCIPGTREGSIWGNSCPVGGAESM